MSEPIIEVLSLSKTYKVGKERIMAVKNISFDLYPGQIKMILGPSGSGKSTLLNLIGGLDNPDAGEIRYWGNSLDKLSDSQRTEMRRKEITLVFQGFELIPIMTCYDNIAYPLKLLNYKKKEIRNRIEYWAGLLKVDFLLHRKPNFISMGQKQRIAIARALVVNPKLVLGDEITANIDRETAYQVLKQIKQVAFDKKTAFLLVTHDSSLTVYADETYHLMDGTLSRLPEVVL